MSQGIDLIAAQKAALRKAARAARDAAANPQTAQAGAALLSGFLTTWRGQPAAGYLPMRSEIDPRPVMADLAQHGPVGVPVIEAAGAPLAFSLWTPGAALVAGGFGTMAPAEHRPMQPRVLIVPMVAFDRGGYRLGYGGGFYDRTLAQARAEGRDLFCVGFAYGAQEVEHLPHGPHDEPLDAIVTEREVLAFG